MYSLTFDPFDKKDREKAKALLDLLELFEKQEGGRLDRQERQAPEFETKEIISHKSDKVQDFSEKNDKIDAHSLDMILQKNSLSKSEDGKGNHSNRYLIRASKTLEKLYEKYGYETLDFTLESLNRTDWNNDKYKSQRFKAPILSDVCAFVHYSFSNGYSVNQEYLSNHLTGNVKGRGHRFITPDEFIEEINAQEYYGEATLYRYNLGLNKSAIPEPVLIYRQEAMQ